MNRREFVARAIASGLVGTGASCTSGCGTLIYSERVGQPHSRDVDWKIVGLDALGLIFFFVPGVVAFVVDFCTGAIYLPPESYDVHHEYPTEQPHLTPATSQGFPAPATGGNTEGPTLQNGQPLTLRQSPIGLLGFGPLRRLTIPRSNLNQGMIEHAVSRQIGRDVVLTHATARVSPLARLDQFAQQRRWHAADRGFGLSTKRFFERIASATG